MSYTPLHVIIGASETQSIKSTLVNETGATIQALTPVRVDVNGRMRTIDVSTSTSALSIVGITSAAVFNTAAGSVTTQGRVLDIATAFAVGDFVYVSKTGMLINQLPAKDVNGFAVGDFIIKVGVIAKNELDPTKKDLFVDISIVGQIEANIVIPETYSPTTLGITLTQADIDMGFIVLSSTPTGPTEVTWLGVRQHEGIDYNISNDTLIFLQPFSALLEAGDFLTVQF